MYRDSLSGLLAPSPPPSSSQPDIVRPWGFASKNQCDTTRSWAEMSHLLGQGARSAGGLATAGARHGLSRGTWPGPVRAPRSKFWRAATMAGYCGSSGKSLRDNYPAIRRPSCNDGQSKLFLPQLHFHNHFSTSTARQLSIKMAPTKEYALFCLENPLLGTQLPPLGPHWTPSPERKGPSGQCPRTGTSAAPCRP